jgi:hypothetical protein
VSFSARGEDLVWVSEQVGHANPNVTLARYAWAYNLAKQAQRSRRLLEEQFGGLA